MVYNKGMPTHNHKGLEDLRACVPSKKLGMKTSNPISRALDPPKSALAIPQDNEEQNLLPIAPFNISRERLMEGASSTTEVLNEILERQRRPEFMRHWGINE